jgi:hypothetical protein
MAEMSDVFSQFRDLLGNLDGQRHQVAEAGPPAPSSAVRSVLALSMALVEVVRTAEEESRREINEHMKMANMGYEAMRRGAEEQVRTLERLLSDARMQNDRLEEKLRQAQAQSPA